MRETINILLLLLLIGCSSQDHPDKKLELKTISKTWVGIWERQIWQNDGTLEIKSIKHDSLEFSLLALSGGHTGVLDGLASVEGNTATYLEINDGDTCLIFFKLFADSAITIDQKNGSCYAGMSVSYSGDYKNKKLLPKKERFKTLYELEIFKSRTEDSLFKILVGESYSLFVNSTQLTSIDDDLDSLHSIVQSSGVRGLFTFMENIIMIDSANNIWAAVIDDKKVLYFTNDKNYKNKLPNTIDNWRENFKDLEIIYK